MRIVFGMLIALSVVTVFSETTSVVAQDTFFEAMVGNTTSSNITKLATILPPGEQSTNLSSESAVTDYSSSLSGLPTINLFPKNDISESASSGLNDSTTNFNDYIDESIQDYNQQADAIKAKIAASSFTPGDGKVIDLINSIAYFRGQVEVLGAGYPVLHSTEQALIDKINEVGPAAFSPSEQSYITSWVNGVMLDQEKENRYSTVLPGFN